MKPTEYDKVKDSIRITIKKTLIQKMSEYIESGDLEKVKRCAFLIIMIDDYDGRMSRDVLKKLDISI